jgi:hypothetical protein
MKAVKFPVTIETKRLVLRKHSLKIAETMFEALDSDRKRLQEFLLFVPHTKTLKDQKAFLRRAAKMWRRGELFDFGIYERKSGQFMGNIGVHTIAWHHDRCELGYWLKSAFEGYGYVTEAVTELTRICFASGLKRVEIRCSPENIRSAAVAERCGFKLEGHLTKDRVVNGRRHDTLVYGRIKAPVRKGIKE